jgi:hypothetical protein
MKPKKNVYDYKEDESGESDTFFSDMQKIREEFANKWEDVPIGTIFSTGNADIGKTYTGKGDKVRLVKTIGGKETEVEELGEPEVRARHSVTSLGLDEKGDHIIYDFGKTYTVGNSGKADYTPDTFMQERDVMYATVLKGQDKWNKAYIEKVQKHNRMVEFNKKALK